MFNKSVSMNRCKKCKVEGASHALIEFGKTYRFCNHCIWVISEIKETGCVNQFLKKDFGTLKISEVDKNIINARLNRQKGKSPWTDK